MDEPDRPPISRAGSGPTSSGWEAPSPDAPTTIDPRGIPAAHLVSFADRRYRGSLARLRGEAAALGRFATVRTLDERDLGAGYLARHGDTPRRHRRGFGLWTWKPAVIAATLADVPVGDLVVYCDAGCSLNAEGRPRLDDYLALAAGHPTGVLAFALDGTVGQWCKRAALAACDCDRPAARRLPMISATCLVLRSGVAARELVAAWWERMADLRLVDDSPSPGGEHPEFRAHRHDQSLFTLLAHPAAVLSIPDETWWPGAWHARRGFPIHARRWRQRLAWPQWWMRHVPWPRW